MKRFAFLAPLAGAALLAAAPAAGQFNDEEHQAHARFQLYNDCQPFLLYVEPLPHSAKRYGIEEADVHNAAISRIQVSGLAEPEDWTDHYLYLQVTTIAMKRAWGLFESQAFHIRLAFKKTVDDPATGESTYADTWEVAMLGFGGKSFLVRQIPLLMDRFLSSYLKANYPSCHIDEMPVGDGIDDESRPEKPSPAWERTRWIASAPSESGSSLLSAIPADLPRP